MTYVDDGYSIARGLITAADAHALLDAAIDIARGNVAAPTFVTPEQNLAHLDAPQPEDGVSKVFRVHQREPFAAMVRRREIVDEVATRLETDDIDCFLSQFIFKNPGAWGQPCHQDSFYFPFAPARPVVGVWIAATDAALDNGCLYVVPSSHREPVHAHNPDRRPEANLGYYEITDHDLTNAVPVEMEPGDVLFFDSHLMHYSTDNTSSRRRCAMVYHYARAGTIDHTIEQRGYSINDWVPVRRA